jgi:hypothetical protein
MSYQAFTIVLALALLLSGVAEQADNDLNEALGIKNAPLLQMDSRDRHWSLNLEVILTNWMRGACQGTNYAVASTFP